MRPVFVGLGLFLVSCSNINATQPAHYACARDAGGANQCPGTDAGPWVCGFGGFCIDPTAPQAWSCATDSDCVGWRCGFEGVCLDPDAGVAQRCLSDHDCGGGWHCGVLGLCYDARTPAAVGCRGADAGDCAPGWVCGLNQLCHDGQVGAPYACLLDEDCAPGWRCGPDALCVDAAADALRPNADAGAPGSRLVSPMLPPGLPDTLTTQWLPGPTSCGVPTSDRVTVFSHGATFTRLARHSSVWGGAPVGCANGSVDQQTSFDLAALDQTQLSFSGARAMTAQNDVTWIAEPDGGVARVTFAAGTFVEQAQNAPLPASGVASDALGLLAFNDTQIAASLVGGGWDVAPPLPGDAGPVAWATRNRRFPQLTALVDDGSQWLLDAADAGAASFSAMSTGQWVQTVNARPCTPVCSDGTTPSSVLLNDNTWDTTADVVLSCGTSADGGVRVEFQLISAAVRCTFVPSSLTVFDGSPWQYRARVGRGDPTVPLNASTRGVAGELGGLWGLSNGVGAELLAQVPAVTTGLVDRPLVAVRVGTLPVDYELTDAGLVSVDTGVAPLTGAVQGHPTWAVFSSVRLTPGVPYEVVDTHGDGLAWPRRPEVLAVFADPNPPAGTPIAAGPAGDGGTLLLAIGQSLYVADLPASPIADATLAPPLRFAAIIQPGVNLTALLQAPPSTGASYALAWAIAGGRVFRVRADNHVVWRVDAPLDRPTEAVRLFADGPRVRVGFSDGSVFAAPSGTLLAAPLQSNASVALDFADVCGNEFMATRDALYELVVDPTSAIGTWTRVPLAATGLLATPLARLQSDGAALLVYRERGVVERLTNLTCLPKQ